jgi:hypothetical protein
MPTIGQALSSPRQAQSAPHLVFAEAEDDDGVFGDLDVRFITGGTGRYAGETGSFTPEHWYDTGVGTTVGYFEGTISSPGP